MIYFLGLLMGYFIGTNIYVEKQASRFVGGAYANPIISQLSRFGGLGGWFCAIPAACIVWADYGNGFLECVYFVLAYISGIMISGALQIPGLNRIFSPLTVFINIGLVFLVYSSS
jgi:hypothetical protein